VSIAAGKFAVALGGNNASALCISDAAATASFAAAPGSGSSRIDLLVLTVHDPTIDAGSTNGFTFDIVLGTASSSPVPPATPADAAVLAQVTSVGGQANLAQSNIVMGAGQVPYALGVTVTATSLPTNSASPPLVLDLATSTLRGGFQILSPGDLWVPQAGSYHVDASSNCLDGAGFCTPQVTVNGSVVLTGTAGGNGGIGGSIGKCSGILYNLAVGARVNMTVWSTNSGKSLNTNVQQTYLHVNYLGSA
jgi:hypothetical protein